MSTRFSGITDAEWRTFVADAAEALELRETDRVYEVQCGPGDFLLPLHEAGSEVGGIDPDERAIAVARERMPSGQWSVGQMATLDVTHQWDAVVACGVFTSGWTPEEGFAVLEKMVALAGTAVAILAVPAGLPFDERWFLRSLATLGAASVRLVSLPRSDAATAESPFSVIARLH